MAGWNDADQFSSDDSNKPNDDNRDRDSGCHDGQGGPPLGPDGRSCDREGDPGGPMPTEKPSPDSPFPY